MELQLSDASLTTYKRTRAELENRVWYRLLKVLFIFVYIAVLLLSETLTFHAPEKVIDNKATLIRCADGRSFSPASQDLYLTSYIWQDDQQKIQALCSDPSDVHKNPYADVRNYTVNTVYIQVGSWGHTALVCFLVLVCVHLTMSLIKRTFFYIAIGRFWA